MVKNPHRDFSKSDGIPNERWAMAEIIYTARIKAAWGDYKNATPPPRLGYTYSKEVADFDLALAVAKELIKTGYVCKKEPCL